MNYETKALPSGEHDVTQNVVESLVLRGDISALTPDQKIAYYLQTCRSLGLNPTAQPFAVLKLSGKEVLYASRGATDQLAANNKLNREIVDGPRIFDLGGTKLVYAVAKVTLPNGRSETAVATLPLTDPVNVLMKVETKAKRRATLSILGLGQLDDSDTEVFPVSEKVEVAVQQEPSAPQLPDPIEALQSRIADLGGEVTAEQGGALYADLELEAVPAEQRTELKTKAWEILRKAFQGPAARLKAHALFAQLLNDCARIETRPELEALVLKPEVINTIARLPYQNPDERGQACKILGDCAYTIGWVGFDSWLQERILRAGGKPPTPPRGGGAPKPTTSSNDSVEGEPVQSSPSLGEALAMKELRDSIAEKQADRKLTDDSKAIGIGRAYAKRIDDLGRYRAEARALVIDALLPLGSGDEAQASARLDGIVKAYQGSGKAPSMVRRAA